MREIEDFVSPFIESQFPTYVKDSGPNFIAFAKAYYEWMESSGQSLQLGRDLFENRDIDKTVDSFIIHFKEKYLADLPLDAIADKRLLIKHIQDLYRTKGTERGIELLFRLLYNVDATVYYPADDIFKLSNGEWKVPEYIEVSPEPTNYDLVGQTILGTTSKATAFIERIVKKRVAGKFIDVFFISARDGNFQFKERIVAKNNPTIQGAPKVVGSLSSLIVTNGGQDFNIGDVLTINTGKGQQGKALVTGVSTETGRVNFSIEDGGFGYTTNAQVLISQRNLTLQNVINADTSITGFQRFETIEQPLATIAYSSTSNSASFTEGSIVENYHVGNGAVSANALILLNTTTNGNTGTMVVVPISGNIASDSTFSLAGNTTTAVIDLFTDSTATANLMFVSNTSLGVVNTVNEFVAYPGNFIRGRTSNTFANVSVRSTGTSARFSVGSLTNEENVLVFSDLLRAKNTGNVTFMDIKLDGSNSNVASNAYGFAKYSGGDINTTLQNLLRFGNKTIGQISVLRGINPGEGYNADPFVAVIEPDIASLSKRDFTLKLTNLSGVFVPGETVEMSSNATGQQIVVSSFNGTSANGDSTSAPEIGEFVFQSNGTSNTATGFVFQTTVTAGSGTIRLSNTTGTFVNSLDIQSLTTNATANVSSANLVTLTTLTTGIVKTSNTSAIKVRRLALYNDFENNYSLLGRLSGATANIIDVAEDESVLPIGENALINANVQIANTVVSTLEVIDSGFGYVEDETVTLSSDGNEQDVTARVVLTNQGRSEGYYNSEKGFLDASTRIHDGKYYQEYSYEVQSRIPLDKYASVLKQVMHTAGTTFFGKVIFDTAPEITTGGLTISDFVRLHNISIFDGNGTYVVGETVNQGNTSGIYRGHTGTITIANSVPLIEIGTQISAPSFSSNSSSARVVAITSNNTHSTLFTTSIEGTIDSSDNFEAITGRVLGVNNVQQGNTVTGSFAVGEVLYQANTIGGVQTANGIVSQANSTTVVINDVYGTWNTNTIVYGVTSNAYANTLSVVNSTNTYSSITSINTIHISNAVGQFVTSSAIVGSNGATSNVSYVSITLDT